jgi:hypothetical protein
MKEQNKKRKTVRQEPEILEWVLAIDLLRSGEQVK